jgi:hypothetical protein
MAQGHSPAEWEDCSSRRIAPLSTRIHTARMNSTSPRRFTRGSNPGTATCSNCGKRTWASRAQDQGAGYRLCQECYDEAGYENEHQDGYHAADQNGPSLNCPMCRPEQAVVAAKEERIEQMPGRPRPSAPAANTGATIQEGATTVAATVTPISPAVSDRRAAAIATRKANVAARKARLEKMTDEQKAQFKAQEKIDRQAKRAAAQSKRPVKVQRVWLEGLADTLVKIAAAVTEGKPLNYGSEVLKPEIAISRIATAVRAQVATTKKAVAKATEKIWVVVRTAPDGSKLAYDKSFRGSKAFANATTDANKKDEFLKTAGIPGYSFQPMNLAEVQAQEIGFASQQASAA